MPYPCPQCESLAINGVLCHEHGCPEAWRDYIKECKWCGTELKPDRELHYFCSQDCAITYNGG